MSRMPMSERTLTLVRHAKAENQEGKPDHERALAPRGRKDADAIGVWLSDPANATVPELALCSTSVRTRQTLERIVAAGASVKETRFDERIYNAGAVSLLEILREVPDSVSTVLVIGHAPGIPVLATALAHNDSGSTDVMDRLSLEFPTAGVAVLGFNGFWSTLAPETAYLRDFVVLRG
ncbi:MAG: phosphohistidine phosphatase [Actinomycetota bacterium]|jgi:phosphohistidine phosphatase|nr:phosphohistidine phosphatase [Actinomycetota bacterium]